VSSIAAPPFSAWERSLAGRYLRAKRKEGGVALISLISVIGITLAVAVLIIVMSVMNGFRAELLGRTLGFSGHMHVTGAYWTPACLRRLPPRSPRALWTRSSPRMRRLKAPPRRAPPTRPAPCSRL
jgi:ABC-type lipoprotein release transport system permease subunit